MDQKQTVFVLATVIVLAVMLITAVYLGQQDAQSGVTGTTKRLLAKAGTTRENARFLRSKRAPTERPSSGETSGNQDRPGEWGEPEYDVTSVTTQDPTELDATPEAAAVRSVLKQLESGEGFDLVLKALKEGSSEIEESEVLTQLGEVYGQFEPPRTEAAQAAFDRALATTVSSETRAAILAAAAEQYLDAGEIDGARVRIDAGLANLEGVSPIQLRLNVLLARSYEERDEIAKARELYMECIDRALLLPPEDAAARETVDMLRLASTRLAWIYHREDRHDEAQALASRVRPRLTGDE